MSIEKKYTEEEIKAIVDEEWSKLKASRELSLDGQAVSSVSTS